MDSKSGTTVPMTLTYALRDGGGRRLEKKDSILYRFKLINITTITSAMIRDKN